MSWIDTVEPDDADGLLKNVYDAATQRAGGVANILRAMSLGPAILESSMALYVRVMMGAGPLPRRQREMLAVVVSRANHCHY